ncbi:autotransporter outer membrane beta-barrel domain-containing protein [Variovorax sp. LjRoot178]|uniref:autotransporter outer membrane beta-barrel domain-containing protein n=1 Tax=Variovorax sp. LjRoot178 TaxID=3342277 RepID=UPI003F5117A5
MLFDAALLVAALSATFARAASLSWDSSGLAATTSTATDGGGTWDTTTARWNNNATDLVWNNAAGDLAIIGNNNGAGGVLNLATPITVGGLVFNAPASGSYTLSGSTLTLSGNRTVTTNANATIGSALSVAGTLTKDGAGTLTLTGGGAVSGATTVANGTLVFQGPTTSSPSYVISSGAVLEANVASGLRDWAVTTSFSGTGTLRKTGAGTIRWGLLPGTFALGRGALIDVQQGTFIGGSNANENWTANLSDLRVASGAVFSGVEANVRVNVLSGAGTIMSGLNGAGYSRFTFGVDNGSGTFDGVLSDNASFRGNYHKVGSGTQAFTQANTFSGQLLIGGGVLSVSAVNQLGTGINYLAIQNGATLRYTGTGSETSTLRDLYWNSGAATIEVTAATGALTLDISGGVRNQAFTKSGAGQLILRKTTAINEFKNSPLIVSGGILEFNQANPGAITRFGGVVTGAAGTQISVSGSGYVGNDALTSNWSANLASLDVGSGASFDLRGEGITVDALTGGGTVANSFVSGVETLVVGINGGSGTFDGTIRQTAPTGFVTTGNPIVGLTKTGAGTQTLTGISSYSGGTSLNGGTLSVAQDGNLGAAAGVLRFNGGTLRTTADFSTARATTLNAQGGTIETQIGTLTHAGLIGGAGALAKTGAGSLILTGANTFAGGTTITLGTLQLGNGGTTGSIVGNVANNAKLAFNRSDTSTFAGVISGTGTVLQIGAGTTVLTSANAYSGGTTIASGVLQISSDANLGAAAGVLDFNGGTLRTTADFSTARATTLNTPGGTIETQVGTLTHTGLIGGAGALAKTGPGALILTGSNTYAGGTTITAGTLQLGNGGTTGSIVGNVANNGALVFDRSNVLSFSGVISGTGSVSQIGTGTTVLAGANTYTGPTTVSTGTLQAGAAHTFSAASAHTVAAGTTLDTAGFNQRVAALDNGGTVSLVSAVAGSTLTVAGAYLAHSLLRLGTGLAGGTSVSDRLVLDGPGASASGNTTIQIANLAGLGALTTGNGIEVVSGRNGATTTAQTTKSAFGLANGHVDAGAYEYRLYAADALGAGENWYLRSTAPAAPPLGAVLPSVTPTSPAVQVPTYRAEVPLLAALPAQLRQADLAMLGNLHRRIGDETNASIRRAWARAVYADLGIQQPGIAQVLTDGHVSGLQAGTDLWMSGDWRAGLYVGYLDGSADVTGNARALIARVGSNSLQSRFLGAYATWMDASGLYVDSVLQAGSQRYTVRPDISPSISGKASSFAASIETGKPFALNERWSIEPQAQLIYQRLRPDDTTLSGAQVRHDAADGWIARLGVRVKGDIATGAGRLQPYARLNMYRASFGDDVVGFIGPAGTTAIASAAGYSAAEAAAGATLALTPATSLYGEIGHLWNIGGDATVKSSVQASLGIKLRW